MASEAAAEAKESMKLDMKAQTDAVEAEVEENQR
jgi:hypothetical protein